MIIAPLENQTLEDFLQRLETEPPSEFIKGNIAQKPMPQGEHSLLQGELCETINRIAKPPKIAWAFPELRCTFGEASIVPDVSVFRWERIPRTPTGRIANRVDIYPDWVIEILSPEQSQNRVLAKLLHAMEYGTELGWLIDPDDESVLIIWADKRVQLCRDNSILPVLTGVELDLTAEGLIGWLTV